MKLSESTSVTKRLSLDDLGEVVLVNGSAVASEERGRNVFLVGNDGQVLWQIEPPVQSHGVVCFENIYFGRNGELLAYSSNGIEYILDRATGRILDKELVR
jgi:hypothetical protein